MLNHFIDINHKRLYDIVMTGYTVLIARCCTGATHCMRNRIIIGKYDL